MSRSLRSTSRSSSCTAFSVSLRTAITPNRVHGCAHAPSTLAIICRVQTEQSGHALCAGPLVHALSSLHVLFLPSRDALIQELHDLRMKGSALLVGDGPHP